MARALCGWMMLACAVLAAAEPKDTVLRFLSQKEIKAQKAKAMEKLRAKNTVCANKITQCPEDSTCCPLLDGQYGCCDGVNAVCCLDGVHCCPQGFACDVEHGQCSSATLGISFHWEDKKMMRAHPVVRSEVGLTCPGNKTVCQNTDTCCNSTTGYRCCPLPHAVCCLDKAHCCPVGTQCDLQHKRCFRKENNWYQPMVKRRRIEQSMKSKAVCCSDHVHCCPAGYTCNYTVHGCVQKLFKLVHSKDTQVRMSSALSSPVTTVTCPGETSECPDGNTCCRLPSGDWGCCPRPNAVCCEDHLHCCPQGYTCDSETARCNSADGAFLPWEEKKPATPRSVELVVCPGGRQRCPDSTTCCQMESGMWGCCGYPKAVCCTDRLHCCPSGYTCDETDLQCYLNGTSMPWAEKKPAAHLSVNSVVCPGRTQECPDNSTCCKLTSGMWGCCPYPKAVCCSDQIHCCPNGYTCDEATSSCTHSGISFPWGEKTPAASSMPNDVVCPDGQSQCADGQTCCKNQQGGYACCPDSDAVCCSDKIHCCPHGYKCNLAAKTCDRTFAQSLTSSIPLLVKKPTVPRMPNAVVCPDGQSQCADGQTCCKNAQGAYSCCPDPNATCCSDMIHCCPNGYTCNMLTKTCDKASSPLMRIPQNPTVVEPRMVICPDKTSKCADGQTCCKLTSGEYGCCPYPEAVCCADHLHCCPKSYTCASQAGMCKKGFLSMPWEKKKPAAYRYP